MSAYRLDIVKLRSLLDAKRRDQGLTWRGVARVTGVGTNAVHRATKGHKPDADGLIGLLMWLDVNAAEVACPAEEPLPCEHCHGTPGPWTACLACGAEGPR